MDLPHLTHDNASKKVVETLSNKDEEKSLSKHLLAPENMDTDTLKHQVDTQGDALTQIPDTQTSPKDVSSSAVTIPTPLSSAASTETESIMESDEQVQSTNTSSAETLTCDTAMEISADNDKVTNEDMVISEDSKQVMVKPVSEYKESYSHVISPRPLQMLGYDPVSDSESKEDDVASSMFSEAKSHPVTVSHAPDVVLPSNTDSSSEVFPKPIDVNVCLPEEPPSTISEAPPSCSEPSEIPITNNQTITSKPNELGQSPTQIEIPGLTPSQLSSSQEHIYTTENHRPTQDPNTQSDPVEEPIKDPANDHIENRVQDSIMDSVSSAIDPPVQKLIDLPVKEHSVMLEQDSINHTARDSLSDSVKQVRIPIKDSVQEPIDNPVQELIDDPAQESTDNPVQESIDDPVQDPVDDPVQEPIDDSVQASIDNPVKEFVDDPVQEHIDDSVQASIDNPVKESVDDPVQEPIHGSVQASINSPVKESVDDPVKESVDNPVQEPIHDSVQASIDFSRVKESVEDPVKESVEEVKESVDDPVKESVGNPTHEPIDDDPVQESTDDPVQESIGDPVQESIDNPVKDSVYDPVKESADHPVKEPVDDPVKEPVDTVQESLDISVRESLDNLVKEPLDDPVKESLDDPVLEATTDILKTSESSVPNHSQEQTDHTIPEAKGEIPMETGEDNSSQSVTNIVLEKQSSQEPASDEDIPIIGSVNNDKDSSVDNKAEVMSEVSNKTADTSAQDSNCATVAHDASPSLDENSVDNRDGKSLVEQQVTNTYTAVDEPMNTEASLDIPIVGCSSEDNSKDVPPQDFKPFSNYTEDGKLIGDADEISEEAEPTSPPQTDAPITAPVELSADQMSIDDSFPGVCNNVKALKTTMQVTSQFQGQFMDFLKCNDNATQHSFTANSAENSVTGDGSMMNATEGEAMIGGEVTADGTNGSQVQDEGSQSCPVAMENGLQTVPATPRTGKKRGRKRKSEIEAQRLADAAAGIEATPKPARSLRKRKAKAEEKTDGETVTEDNDEKAPDVDPSNRKKAASPELVPCTLPAEKLFEYQWPQDKAADWFFLQEHLSSFLGIKSFKRKYPDLIRRTVGMPERNFLQENGVVSEMQCDLGLTSLKSEQVYELLLKDFPLKYKAYAQVLREREHARVAERKRAAAELAKLTKNDLGDVVKRAIRSAAEFNAQFMREKREERKAYFDLQTTEIHYPRSTRKVLPPEVTKIGAYPVALIPGQFHEHYKRYSNIQMKYFPINTATYDSPKHLKTIYADPNDKYESELDSQSVSSHEEEEDGSSSSGSSSGSGSDGESDSSSDAPEPEVIVPTPTTTKKARAPRGKKAAAVVKDTVSLCNICQGTSEKNKIGEAEELVKCSACSRHGHPSCLELTEEMIPNIKTYKWQCMECKTCVECMDPYDEDKMMFCDHCDRGYHTFCVGLRGIPTGRWECPSCRPDQPAKKKRRQNLV